jgi:hypothetical protein
MAQGRGEMVNDGVSEQDSANTNHIIACLDLLNEEADRQAISPNIP